MGGKGLSHLINVGVGTGNSEVTSIGAGEKVDGLGECGGKEVEYVGYIHYTGALRNTYSSMNGVGEVILWTIF